MMKSPQEKDRKNNPQQIQVPDHERVGRIMSPPPFELDASWTTPAKRKEEEEEVVEGQAGKEQQ